MGRRLRTKKVCEGQYSLSTRTGEASTKNLLKKFGDKIFDPAPDRHNKPGSGRA